jgi:hypothetical protein
MDAPSINSFSTEFNSNASSELSTIHLPQAHVATTFVLAHSLLSDPFVTQAPLPAPVALSPNQPEHRVLWSSYSSSSSRPSPVYLGQGRYRLPDGTLHDINLGQGSLVDVVDADVLGSMTGTLSYVGSDEDESSGGGDDDHDGDDSSSPLRHTQSAPRQLQSRIRDVETVFSSQALREGFEELSRTIDELGGAVTSLIREVESRSQENEELRRLHDQRTQELAALETTVRRRDARIHRLSNLDICGRDTTPPDYSVDTATGHSSVLPANDVPAHTSPTPAARVGTNEDMAPSALGNRQSESMTPETRIRTDPPSSESRQSDSALLYQTPCHRG